VRSENQNIHRLKLNVPCQCLCMCSCGSPQGAAWHGRPAAREGVAAKKEGFLALVATCPRVTATCMTVFYQATAIARELVLGSVVLVSCGKGTYMTVAHLMDEPSTHACPEAEGFVKLQKQSRKYGGRLTLENMSLSDAITDLDETLGLSTPVFVLGYHLCRAQLQHPEPFWTRAMPVRGANQEQYLTLGMVCARTYNNT
jgi:hypothetical protein